MPCRHMISRQQFLSSIGVCIALPALASFGAPKDASKKAKAFVAIGANLGWHQKGFYPKEAGANYAMPEILEPIAGHRRDFTIFSGLDHQAPNGHNHWANFLCGQRVGSYSLDQVIADNPLSPPSDPVQRRLQSPPAKSNFLAVP